MLLALWPGAHCDSSLARAVTDSRGYVSGDRACHAMGVSASARRIVRRVDLGRIVAVSDATDTSDATAGAIVALGTWGAFERRVSERLRSPQGLKIPAEGKVRRMRLATCHAAQPKGDQHARQPCLSSP